jgi:glycosyltransferase involved in cell wall biosynthesis
MSVVICTPTFNRKFSLEFSSMVMKKQTYKDIIGWVIIDNSSDDEKSWEDVTKIEGLPPVIYVRIHEKKPIGALRNICVQKALELKSEYIAFWDDDDYYPSQRITKSVEALENNKTKDIVGCEIMTVFVTEDNVLMDVGPYGANHATASVWLFRASIAKDRKFNDTDLKAEEGAFTRDWTLPMVMLSQKDLILVIGHAHNTVNKRQMVPDPSRFAGKLTETANGKNIVRFQWFRDRELWDCFYKTFLLALANQ